MSRWSCRAAVVLVLIVSSECVVAADCRISGRVHVDRLPVRGARIATVVGDQAPVLRGTSGPDGRFSISIEAVPEGYRAVTLVTTRPPSPQLRMILLTDSASGCPRLKEIDVPLETSGRTPVAEVDQDLCASPSVQGLTLYVAPYEIFGGEDLAPRINRDLPRVLHHGILAFQSRLGVGPAAADISVESICVPLTAADGERLRSIGLHLNALGVIAGEGELRQTGRGDAIDLISVFRGMPTYRDHGGHPVRIGDTIPADILSPSRLADQLSDIWGKQALLTYVVLRYAQLPRPANRTGEAGELEGLLLEIRRTMTRDDPLLEPLQQLLGLIQGDLE